MKRKVTTIKSGIYIKVVHGLIRSYRRVCCVKPSSPIPSLKKHMLFEVKMPWRYVLLCQISYDHQIGISVDFKHLFNALNMLSVKLVYEKSNRSLLFSCSRKIPTLGSTVHLGIFMSPLNTNEGFYISHIPISAHGKDKKRTAARKPHARRTSFRDVNVMLKSPCRISANSRFSGSLSHDFPI